MLIMPPLPNFITELQMLSTELSTKDLDLGDICPLLLLLLYIYIHIYYMYVTKDINACANIGEDKYKL